MISMDESMDDYELRHATLCLALHRLETLSSDVVRTPLHTGGMPGNLWIHRLLTTHPNLCKEQLRLHKDIFISLVAEIRARQLLIDGRFVRVEEQLGICLFMLGKSSSVRDAAERFQHSVATISKYFQKVLEALITLSRDIIRPYQSYHEVPEEIQNNAKFWPFFKDCVGAIDGTLIQSTVGDAESSAFRDRHGNKTWNIMVACSFNMLVTFINVGFEGSAHDSKVWRHCLGDATMGFPHPPPRKYYVVDSCYPSTLGYLSPHAGSEMRYHLPTFQRGGAPRGKYETFNYRHASCRNVIERVFGNVKNRWKVLKMMPHVGENEQLAIIVACFTLHNYIRLHELNIPVTRQIEVMERRADYNLYNEERKMAMGCVRDSITNEIWQSVQFNNEEQGGEEFTNYDEN